jgi:TetR/AcrR family transcriptional regulator, regulator of cefoperazone and chloramphenicol sensitivity
MNAKRPNRREVAAAETRGEILRAARRLFAERGYTNTSIHQIAEESGVAVQTIYSSIGSKAALVLALNDLVDAEADVSGLAAQLMEENDPHQLVAKGVHLTRQLNERCGDLIRVLLSAEPAEPDVAAAVADGIRRHQRGAHGIAQRLGSLGALRSGMSTERAAAVFAMMTSPANWRQLTRDSDWSFDEAETWLTDSLSQLLLNPNKNPKPRSRTP